MHQPTTRSNLTLTLALRVALALRLALTLRRRPIRALLLLLLLLLLRLRVPRRVVRGRRGRLRGHVRIPEHVVRGLRGRLCLGGVRLVLHEMLVVRRRVRICARALGLRRHEPAIWAFRVRRGGTAAGAGRRLLLLLETGVPGWLWERQQRISVGATRRRERTTHHERLCVFLARDERVHPRLLRRPPLDRVHVQQPRTKVDERRAIIELCIQQHTMAMSIYTPFAPKGANMGHEAYLYPSRGPGAQT